MSSIHVTARATISQVDPSLQITTHASDVPLDATATTAPSAFVVGQQVIFIKVGSEVVVIGGAGFGIGSIVTVNHGLDSSVPRPDADTVRWRGSAHPDNFQPGDFWYDGTEFD